MNKYEKFYLKVINGNEINDCSIELIEEKSSIVLIYLDDTTSLRVKDIYPFEALISLRKKLEPLGKKIVCKGSRIDAYPSGSQLLGIHAYLLKISRKSEKKNLINIFSEEENLEKIVSVKEQLQYRDKWIKSVISDPEVWKYLDNRGEI